MVRLSIGLVALVMILSPAILLVLTATNLPAGGPRRRWYVVPWLPVLVHACWIGAVTLADPTSHNLFPFELGISSTVGLLVFGALYYTGVLPRRAAA